MRAQLIKMAAKYDKASANIKSNKKEAVEHSEKSCSCGTGKCSKCKGTYGKSCKCGSGECPKCKMMEGKSKMAYQAGAVGTGLNYLTAPKAPPPKPVSNTLAAGVPGYSSEAAIKRTGANAEVAPVVKQKAPSAQAPANYGFDAMARRRIDEAMATQLGR